MPPALQFERVYYYWRQSMFGHVHLLCAHFLKTQGTDPQFIIWDALAYGAEGKTSTGIQTLEKIKNRVAAQLEVCVAELYIHKKAKMQDFASISQLETELESLKASASASSIVSAAKILWLTGDNNQALNFVQPLTTQPPPNREAAALLGWIKLTEADRNSGRYFDMANADASVGSSNVDPFVLYGKAMYFSSVSRWPDAISLLVQLAGIADFPEANLERARFYIASNSWDLALEAAQEGQGHYVSDTDLYYMQILHDLSQTGNLEGARRNIETFVDLISKTEGQNAIYVTLVSKVIFALCWKDIPIVKNLLKLFPPLMQSNNENASFLQAYSELLIAAKRPKETIDMLQTAIVQDAELIASFANLVEANIQLNNMGEASTQLEFLKMNASSSEPPLSYYTLEEKIQRLSGLPTNVEDLLKAMRAHTDKVAQVFTPQSSRISPDRKMPSDAFTDEILQINLSDFADALQEAMEYCNTLDRTVADPHNGEVCDLIVRMLEFIPGAVPFSYYLAVLGFGEGRYAQVTKAIQFVLNSKWGFNASQCHLLLAQIRLQMKQFDEAELALNRAVSFDFSIRSGLRYNMILAQLNDARGQYDKAVETINNLMKTSEYTTATSGERLKVNIFLSHVYKKMGKLTEAMSNIDNSMVKFTQPEETGQLQLCKATLLASSDRIPDALHILDSFEVQNPLYSKARKKAAKIYLDKLKDKTQYIKCFKQLCDASPTKTNFSLLGDAMMKVKRFDDAVECFKRSAELDLGDAQSALHLARALMIVHRYEDSMKEYDRAVTVSGNDQKIQLEECKALVKLRNYDAAEELANEAMQDIDIESGDWESQYVYAQLSELVSIIESKRESPEDAADLIADALSVYDRLTAPNRVDIPSDAKKEIHQKAAELYQKSAEAVIESGKPLDDAEQYLKKAADLDETSSKAMVALARLYSESGRTDDAKEACAKILRQNPNCEEAAMILADISATENLQELENSFFSSPNFFHTLVRLIEICARQGVLDRVPSYFEKTDKNEPGAIFANGLYQFYIGNPMKALEFFHQIRNDPEWGVNAQIYSFHIYANPARKFVWCQEKPIASPNEIEAANKILKRLQNHGVDTTQFEATLLLSRNTPDTVQQALEIYNKLDADDISVTIGKCRCYMRLGQQNQVTRNLNSVIHSEPSVANISNYVEAFLMMTQISLKDQSFDEAEKWIGRATELDKSCVKAWEMQAQIYEKKKDHASAADALENAWKLTSNNDCNVGYRLAVNYMKSQNPGDAIKVARVILSKHPNFPKIKEQVLIPCCGMIRQ